MVSHTTRKRNFILLMSVLIGTLGAGCTEQQKIPSGNFENHPVYKHYRFSNDEKVIEIGVVVPSVLVNHIVEVMKRDEILKEDLDRLGYTLKFHPYLKGDDINYYLKMGALEGAVTGDMPMLKMASTGDITVLALVRKGGVSLVSRDLYRVRDLKRKRVAYPHGTIAHYYLLRLLKEHGLRQEDIRSVPMDMNAMFEAIGQGRIDAFTAFEPTATVYTRIDPTLHAINRSFSSYSFFSMRNKYAVAHKPAVLALLAAQFRARAWLGESSRNLNRASRWVAGESEKFSPLPLKKYVAELDALCAEDLLSNILDYDLVMNRDVLGDNGDVRQEFEFLKEKGFLSRDREWNDIKANIDTRMAREALMARRPAAPRVRP